MRPSLSIKTLFRTPFKTHEDGYCVIVVTHDMDVANTADVMYRMTDGALSMNEK